MNAGVEYAAKTKIERNGIEATQVKSIKLMTDLDDGSANNDTNTILEKSGIVFNKTYEFKVDSYTNDDPEDKNLIKWAVSYTDIETGIYYKNALEDAVMGDTISITFKNQKMCGSNLEIKAYINDLENEGKLSLFKHNRFRFFDREIIKKEIKDRMYAVSKIDQGQSSMCAIALIGHFLAIQNPTEYEKVILNLHRKGETYITSNNYLIKLDSDEHLVKVKDSDTKYPKDSPGTNTNMSFADFVFQFSIKDFLNNVFDYDPDGPNSGVGVEGTTGFTPPNEVHGMMKNIMSYSDIKDKTNILSSKWSSAKKSSEELKEALTDGYSIALLISADNFSKNEKSFLTFPNHWVGLKDIFIDEANEKINVKVFTSGDVSRSWTLSVDSFEDGYFGYVAGK